MLVARKSAPRNETAANINAIKSVASVRLRSQCVKNKNERFSVFSLRIDIDHECPMKCTYTLSCGKHKCESTCHKGRCLPCYRSSFDELYCECGANVIYPPVPCGTKRPACDKPCSRQHPCDHEVTHNCTYSLI